MRKIFAFLMTSVDGYHEGRDGQFDWPVVDREFSEFSAEQLDEADTLLFGHRTYQTMAAYWPTAVARASDPRVAAQMNDYPKIVVSRTAPTRLSWGPTQVLREDFDRHLTALKAQTGKDIAVLGSS